MPRKNDSASLHGRIIRDAWHVAWHHKHLWVFGFFATLIGFGGVSEAFFNAFDLSASAVPSMVSPVALVGIIPGMVTIRAIASYSSFPAVTLAVFLLSLGILAAVFAWMTCVSVGALVSDTRKIVRGGEPTFSEGLKAGSEKFWRLFWVNALAKLAAGLMLLITGANLAIQMRDRGAVSTLFFVGSFVVGVIVAFVASLVSVYGSVAVVAKNEPVGKAVRGGLALSGQHWFVSLEMAVLLTLVSLATGIGVAVVMVIASIPLLFLIAISSTLQAAGAVAAVIVLTAVLILSGVVALGSFLTVFMTAAWTMLWEELHESRPLPKLLRWAGIKKRTKK